MITKFFSINYLKTNQRSVLHSINTKVFFNYYKIECTAKGWCATIGHSPLSRSFVYLSTTYSTNWIFFARAIKLLFRSKKYSKCKMLSMPEIESFKLKVQTSRILDLSYEKFKVNLIIYSPQSWIKFLLQIIS